MYYQAVSSKDRLPTLWKSYFIVIDGRKDIVPIPWMQKRVERYPDCEFHWLEEVADKPEPCKIKKPTKKSEAISARIADIESKTYDLSSGVKPWLKR